MHARLKYLTQETQLREKKDRQNKGTARRGSSVPAPGDAATGEGKDGKYTRSCGRFATEKNGVKGNGRKTAHVNTDDRPVLGGDNMATGLEPYQGGAAKKE